METDMKAAGILAIDMNTGKVLLVKRSSLCSHPGTWAAVGGKVDDEDSTPRIAAVREFKEEVQPDEPYELSKLPFSINYDGHVKFYTYIGIFKNSFVPVLNEENTEYGWFELGFLPDKMLPACLEMFQDKKEAIERVIRKFQS